VRSVFHILVFTLETVLLMVTLVSVPGLSLVRCAHTGKIYLEEFNETDCGLDDGDMCMEHFTLQISGNIKAPTFQAPASPWTTLAALAVSPVSHVVVPSFRPSHFPWHSCEDPPDIHQAKTTYLRI